MLVHFTAFACGLPPLSAPAEVSPPQGEGRSVPTIVIPAPPSSSLGLSVSSSSIPLLRHPRATPRGSKAKLMCKFCAWILALRARMTTERIGVPILEIPNSQIVVLNLSARHPAPPLVILDPSIRHPRAQTRGSKSKPSPQFVIQVPPVGIEALDQVDLPLSIPSLERFLSLDCIADIEKFFIPDQLLATIFGCETGCLAFTVLVDSTFEIRRNADVECSELMVGGDVNISRHAGNYLCLDGTTSLRLSSSSPSMTKVRFVHSAYNFGNLP